MSVSEKGMRWVCNADVDGEQVASGVERKILAYCDELMCVENFFDTGSIGAVHTHPHTQIGYVAEGVFEFTIGDEKKVVKKGDSLLLQDGIPHGCVCLEKGILVDFFTPMRKDFVK